MGRNSAKLYPAAGRRVPLPEEPRRGTRTKVRNPCQPPGASRRRLRFVSPWRAGYDFQGKCPSTFSLLLTLDL